MTTWKKATGPLCFLALATAMQVSCGSGDDSSNGGGGVFIATFSPAGSPVANSISMQPNTANGAAVVVNFDATQMTDLYGAAYTITYSPAVLNFVGADDAGTFLATGGVTVLFNAALENGQEGRLVVGISRAGQVSGVSGSGTLHNITFRGVAVGSTSLNFTSASAIDSNGTTIPGVTYSGGTVSVTGG
ncbi:MAG: cohesin domain-containing protein [Acidobacteriota bacterium]